MRIVIVLIALMDNAFAYLDPSTGSLLVSSIVAIFASAIFFIKNLFYKLMALVSGGGGALLKHKNSYALVFYSEGKQYYGVFRPILDALHKLRYPYILLTSDASDPFLKEKKFHTKFIGTGNRAYAYLNSLSADIVVMTTPGLDVLQIKRSKGVHHYCHIVHSLGSPNYRTFGMDYFDSVLVNSSIQESFIRSIEQAHHLPQKLIRNIGSTYIDWLSLHSSSKKFFKSIKKGQKIVLLSPSWGREALLSKYGMNLIRPLLDSGFLVIIRPHPQSFISESALIEGLEKELRGEERVVFDKNASNLAAMMQSDLMISDFSGIIFDYLCLFEKPVFSIEYDFDHSGYDSMDVGGLWEFEIFKKLKIGLKIEELKNISKILKSKNDIKYKKEVKKLKKLLWSNPGKSGMIAASTLLEIYKEILFKKLGDKKVYSDGILEIDALLDQIGRRA